VVLHLRTIAARERERELDQDLIRSHLSCPRAGVICAGQKLDVAMAHAI
jgi:hypothetical protein